VLVDPRTFLKKLQGSGQSSRHEANIKKENAWVNDKWASWWVKTRVPEMQVSLSNPQPGTLNPGKSLTRSVGPTRMSQG